MNKIITIIALATGISLGFSQTLQWAKSYGSADGDAGYTTHVDAVGNNYFGGAFTNTITAGLAADGETTITLTASGNNSDAFIIKKSPTNGLLWAKAFTGTGTCFIQDIATDAANNVFVTGYYKGQIDADPSPTSSFILTPTAVTNHAFIVKLTAAGVFSWGYTIGNDEGDNYGLGIDVDASGNVFAVGNFEGGSIAVDFDYGTGVQNMNSATVDGFVLKLSNAGAYLAKIKMGGSNSDGLRSVKIDDSGNVFVIGNYSSTGFANISALPASAGGSDVVVAKLTNNLVPKWQKGLGGTGSGSDAGYSIDADGNSNLYLTGIFKGTVDLDPSGSTASFTNATAATFDGFITKLDSAGNFIWASQLGGTGTVISNHISVDANSNAYISGYFDGVADFNLSTTATNNITSAGLTDGFTIKVDRYGAMIGNPIIIASADDDKNYSASPSGNDCYITGNFSGTVDVDMGTTVSNLVSAGAFDAFSCKYTLPACNAPTIVGTGASRCGTGTLALSAMPSVGSVSWYTSSSGGSSVGTGTSFTTPSISATTTYYAQAVDGTCISTRTAVVATINPLPTIISALDGSRCGTGVVTLTATATSGATIMWKYNAQSTSILGYGSTFTPNITNTTNYYVVAELNSCASAIGATVIATINANPVATITANGATLTVAETGASYQWINCGTNTNIPGATLQSYTVTANGDYKVNVTKNTCSVTSACANVTITSLDDYSQVDESFKIYPNPNNGDFAIEAEIGSEIEIVNQVGKLIRTVNVAGDKNIHITDLPSGIYMIKAHVNGKAITNKVVITN